jgi:hypothetical protein
VIRMSILLICSFIAFVLPASSCPVCQTDTGAAVRRGIFNDDFGFNLFVTILPFLVFYGVVALVHSGAPSRRTGDRSQG